MGGLVAVQRRLLVPPPATYSQGMTASLGFGGGFAAIGPGDTPSFAAVGYGKNALSATARSDYHVTDGGNGTTSGTLRAALSASNRNIIFDVDTITLTTSEGGEVQQNNLSNIVLDGSSRPNGVSILNQALRWDNCDHVVIRDIAFRNSRALWEGAVQLRAGSHDFLIDRCSFSNWIWRGVDGTVGVHDVTVQWCFFGQSDNDHSLTIGQELHYPAYFGDESYHISFDHNLFYENMYRQPQACYDMDVVGVTDPNSVTLDVANQLLWNTLPAFADREGYWGGVGSKNGSKVNCRQSWFHTVSNTSANHAIFSEQESGADAPGVYVNGCKFKNDAGSLATAFPVGSPYSTTGFDLPLESTAEVAAQQVLLYAGRYPRDSTDAAWAANITL